MARSAPRDLRLNNTLVPRAADIRPLTALTALYLAHNGYASGDLLAALARLPQLRVLDLHRTADVDDRFVLSWALACMCSTIHFAPDLSSTCLCLCVVERHLGPHLCETVATGTCRCSTPASRCGCSTAVAAAASSTPKTEQQLGALRHIRTSAWKTALIRAHCEWSHWWAWRCDAFGERVPALELSGTFLLTWYSGVSQKKLDVEAANHGLVLNRKHALVDSCHMLSNKPICSACIIRPLRKSVAGKLNGFCMKCCCKTV